MEGVPINQTAIGGGGGGGEGVIWYDTNTHVNVLYIFTVFTTDIYLNHLLVDTLAVEIYYTPPLK